MALRVLFASSRLLPLPALQHHVIPGTHDCVGPECFRYGFILCGCAAALGMLFSLPLVPLTQRGRRSVPTKAVR
jgi:hypothetical protein